MGSDSDTITCAAFCMCKSIRHLMALRLPCWHWRCYGLRLQRYMIACMPGCRSAIAATMRWLCTMCKADSVSSSTIVRCRHLLARRRLPSKCGSTQAQAAYTGPPPCSGMRSIVCSCVQVHIHGHNLRSGMVGQFLLSLPCAAHWACLAGMSTDI